ncbi:MAG: S-layer homology domain-containing protein [Bacillota bacterium]|nr:S-layer homology domain-containing protein [Bacillota bacterium]
MKRRQVLLVILVLAAVLAISSSGMSAESYWTWQKDYNAAVNNNDGDAIIRCVKRLEAIYPNPGNETEYARLATPLERCALEYERKGIYPTAGTYYQKALVCYEWLDKHGHDYYDKLLTLEAQTQHLKGYFELYTEVSQPADTPYYKAKNEPEKGTYYGMCSAWPDGDQSAKLQYVQFPSENMEKYKGDYSTLDKDCLIEVAWNVNSETKAQLDEINTGKYDDYIISNLRYLNDTGRKILLRFGAEVNCWSDLPASKTAAAKQGDAYCKSFINAFRRVANYAHQYAPNCAMVYSPNDISNWYFDVTDFYPGDNYVDWVGISSYNNVSANTKGTVGSGIDAFYCHGLYENQLIKVKRIVDAFGDRKPIMISECGFAYASKDNLQTLAHALAAQKYFYTYVNMVYPQVKAVFYFNASPFDEKYMLTGDNGNEELYQQYLTLTRNNASMRSTVDKNNGKYYTNLNALNEVADNLKLTSYVYYPGGKTATVSYQLDGKNIFSGSQYPYAYTTSKPSPGSHQLTAKVVCGNTSQTKTYGLYVGDDGRVSSGISKMTDVAPDRWSYEAISYCMHYDIFKGMSPTTFEPKTPITRAMFVTLLARMSGADVSKYTTSDFSDVQKGKWYTSYVQWAKENQIVNGITATTFAPDQSISREQICVMLVRFCSRFSISLKARDSQTFADDNKISSYAKESVYIAKANGLVAGKGNNSFDPRANASREETATIFMRFKENIYDAR